MRKLLSKFNNLLVYQKMILLFSIMLILLYGISLSLTNRGKNSVEEQYVESVLSKADFYGDLLSENILYLRTRQLQLFSNSNVKRINLYGQLIEPYEEYVLVNNIKEELYMINNSSELVENNGIYIHSYGNPITIGSEFQDFIESRPFAKEESIEVFNVFEDRLLLMARDESGELLSYIQLSEKKLLEMVSYIIEDKKDAGIFFISENENFISDHSPKKEEIIQSISTNEPDQKENNHYFYVNTSNKDEYLITVKELPFLDMTLYTYMNRDEITEELYDVSSGFLILTIIFFLIFVLFAWTVHRMIHKPLNKLLELFASYEEEIEREHTDYSLDEVELDEIDDDLSNEFSYLYNRFNQMTERLNLSIKENYKQKLSLQQSELTQLQAQINPHFLYNSFYNIYRLSKMDESAQVSLLSQRLASYYEFITREGTDLIELKKEYRHALDYCEIQKIRFSHRFQFVADSLTKKAENILVPRLILQPVLENSFEHAIDHLDDGVLHMGINLQNDCMIISIEDNGESLTDEEIDTLNEKLQSPERQQAKTGLFNVCTRLKLRYGEKSGLRAHRSALGGLKIEVVIYDRGVDEDVSHAHS